jgi:hypothetical protein
MAAGFERALDEAHHRLRAVGKRLPHLLDRHLRAIELDRRVSCLCRT